MSNVVQFLESLARNPKPLSAEDFIAAVAAAELEPGAQQALLDQDAAALNQALGGRLKMMCIVAPAENDEPQEGEPDGGGDAPEQDASVRAA